MLLQCVPAYDKTILCTYMMCTVVSVFKVYEENFLGVLDEVIWPQYEGDTLCHNETMQRKKKGRTKITHIRTEMDNIEKEKRKYGICHQISHMRINCQDKT